MEVGGGFSCPSTLAASIGQAIGRAFAQKVNSGNLTNQRVLIGEDISLKERGEDDQIHASALGGDE